MTYRLVDVVGEDCITIESGQRVYDVIVPALKDGRRVELDFDGVTVVAASFLNVAIGQLLREFDATTLNAFLSVVNLPAYACPVLDLVIANAKQYYALDPTERERQSAAVRQAVESL